MKKTSFLALLLTVCSLVSSLPAYAESMSIGLFNPNRCFSESLIGQHHTKAFENAKKQYKSLIDENEKQLNDLIEKRNDPEYRDSLSPEAEQELNQQIQKLNEERVANYNQCSMALNRANNQIQAVTIDYIKRASKIVASNKKLTLLMDSVQCAYYDEGYECTNDVIAQMDIFFKQEVPADASLELPLPPLPETK